MRDFLIAQRREEKTLKTTKKSKSKGKHKAETPEERRARKLRKKEKKAKKEAGKSDGVRAVQDLLKNLGGAPRGRRGLPSRSPSRTPPRRRSPVSRRSPSRSRSRSPRRDDRSLSRDYGRSRVSRDDERHNYESRNRR